MRREAHYNLQLVGAIALRNPSVLDHVRFDFDVLPFVFRFLDRGSLWVVVDIKDLDWRPEFGTAVPDGQRHAGVDELSSNLLGQRPSSEELSIG